MYVAVFFLFEDVNGDSDDEEGNDDQNNARHRPETPGRKDCRDENNTVERVERR